MDTIEVNGKTYRWEYHNKCELCDLRGINGECMLPKDKECEWDYVFKIKVEEEE